jgi:hypothetical protein
VDDSEELELTDVSKTEVLLTIDPSLPLWRISSYLSTKVPNFDIIFHDTTLKFPNRKVADSNPDEVIGFFQLT